MSYGNKIAGWFLLTALLLGTAGYSSTRALKASAEGADRLSHTHTVLESLGSLLSSVQDVETGGHSFLITGRESYLRPHHQGLGAVEQKLETLRRLTSDNPTQQRRVEALQALVRSKVEFVGRCVSLRSQGRADEARDLLLTDKGLNEMEGIRALVRQMAAEEGRLLGSRQTQTQASSRLALGLFHLSVVLSLALLAFVFYLMRREYSRRIEVEAGLEESNAELQRRLAELQRLKGEMNHTNMMGELLQSCLTISEASEVFARSVPGLLPDTSGALCLINSSKNLVQPLHAWGPGQHSEAIFGPHECWALRRGRRHVVRGHMDLACGHAPVPQAGTYQCIPLTAHGETLGVLHIRSPRPLEEDGERVIRSIAEQLSLTFASLNLQSTLRMQSIRDPLTGLFNRRYMEASLEREVIRAQRQNLPVSLIMIDVDHFKRYNDSHGHSAGDMLLQHLGGLLRSSARGDDIACRYGGEEFLLIMPCADVGVAQRRAEKIREAVKQLRVEHRGRVLPPVTISAGVAAFPDHGISIDDVTHLADAALYLAKRCGRDRVELAEAAHKPEPRAHVARPTSATCASGELMT